jgi:predicted phage terminase large subunit-like protein
MSDTRAFGRLADSLTSNWKLLARPEQRPPPGDWVVWLIMSGRGWGKTRTGSEWVRQKALNPTARIALVGATAADTRDVMIEGESGILACSPAHDMPLYEPSKRRLTWKNGAQAAAYSADEADRLRGPQHSAAWGDEAAAWRYPDSWAQLQLGMRLGRPQTLVTTTPRPVKLIRDLLAREGRDVVVTRGKTRDNLRNLAPSFLQSIERQYGGTRIGRQELDGELLEDTPGALWSREQIDRDRVSVVPSLRRIVVAIDPAVTSGEDADETSIIVAGVDGRGDVFVLEHASGRFQPHQWAARAIALFDKWAADRVVAEVNNGGEMVGGTIHMLDPKIPFRAVHASRGKVMRAEPVSALYEQGRVRHVGAFAALEDQMTQFTTDFDRGRAGYSPDRVDALVWAVTDLVMGRPVPTAATGIFQGPYGSADPVPFYATLSAEDHARAGRYHPNDKAKWQALGILPRPNQTGDFP